jgi:glycosyltransferase involved in cell wall biosynthesis
MKKNILILVTAAIGGGVERLILDQMKYFDKCKFDLHVATLRKGYLENEFSNTPSHYVCLESKRRISLKTLTKLLCYIKKHKIDLVHTHLYLPDIHGFLIKISIPRIKLITTKHNTNEFRKKLYWGLLDKLLAWPANQVIAVSHSVKDFISKYEFISPKRIKVIYHGVDFSKFKRKTNLVRLRKQLEIKHKDFVIGIVGRITKQKGHIYLLESVAQLKKKIPCIRLLIIGVGELKNQMEQYANNLGIAENVDFLGFRNDLSELYSLMDVLCLPSIFEGLGLVLVEAMLCNTITVGAKIHGIEEIIEDGVNGFLVPPKDSNTLTKILYRIYQSDFDKKLISRAKLTAQRFNFKKNLKKIEEVYLATI